MKRYLYVVLAIAALIFAGACGGGSSDDSSGSGDFVASSLNELPKATSPMSSSASASLSKDVYKDASVGMPLGSTDSSFFESDSSMGACEMLNLAKEGIGSAAQADMILCFVHLMASSDSFADLSDADGNAIDVYDGEYHVFNLNIVNESEDEGSPDRIKMKIVKDSAGAITSFEMFMCALSGGSLAQNEYTKQEVSNANVTMRAIGQYTDQEGSGWHAVDVSGSLDSNGHYLSREISVSNVGNWGGDIGWSEGVLVQEPGSFSFSGYRTGNYSTDNGGSGTYSDSAYGVGEMLGDTSPEIDDLALGDGAVNFYSLGTYDDPQYGSGTYGPFEEVQAWLGDNGLPVEPATDSAFYEAASAGTLAEIQSEAVSLSFAASEEWDCTDDVSVGIIDLPEFDGPTMNAACSAYMFGHEWINCHEIMGQ